MAEGEGIEPPQGSHPGCRFRSGRITSLPALPNLTSPREEPVTPGVRAESTGVEPARDAAPHTQIPAGLLAARILSSQSPHVSLGSRSPAWDRTRDGPLNRRVLCR